MSAPSVSATATPRAVGVPGMSTWRREANAVLAIAAREVLAAIKSPVSIAFNVIFPIIFIGILGGSINQNLSQGLPYDYLPFMIIGMVANSLYQGTIVGVTNLVEERENDFTAELFVAPISRYAVLLGKIIGAGIASLAALFGIIAMVLVMQVHMDAGDLMRVVALAPLLALSGGALGVFFIGFVHDPKTAGAGVALLVFPQVFLSGALIPVAASTGLLGVFFIGFVHDPKTAGAGVALLVFPQVFLSGALIPVAASTGLLGLLAKLMPMTYSIDLARNIFYWGKPEYVYTVLNPPLLDLTVTVAFFLVFSIVGTFLFVRSDRNR